MCALHLQQAGEDEEVGGAAAVLVRLLVAARGDVILVRPAEPAPITAEHPGHVTCLRQSQPT